MQNINKSSIISEKPLKAKTQDPTEDDVHLKKYLLEQDFTDNISMVELLNIDFDLTLGEESAFKGVNQLSLIKYFKIVLHTLGIQNQKQNYSQKFWEKQFDEKLQLYQTKLQTTLNSVLENISAKQFEEEEAKYSFNQKMSQSIIKQVNKIIDQKGLVVRIQ